MQIIEFAQEKWPWLIGGAIGLYVVVKIIRGNSAAATAAPSDASYLAAQSVNGAAMNAQAQAVQQGALNQLAGINLSAQVEQTKANALLAQSTGQSVANIIAAQSVLPALAINSATTNNQDTIRAAAGVAIAGLQTLPSAMQA